LSAYRWFLWSEMEVRSGKKKHYINILNAEYQLDDDQ
jgi:hypothetical protein